MSITHEKPLDIHGDTGRWFVSKASDERVVKRLEQVSDVGERGDLKLFGLLEHHFASKSAEQACGRHKQWAKREFAVSCNAQVGMINHLK